jgi:hypothetical protein
MKINLIAAGTPDAASSRIRSYTLQSALSKLGVQTSGSFSPQTDVLFIQKRLTPQLLDSARKAKSQNAIVIYDIDDWGEALGDWVPTALLQEMLTIADVVTTDTLGHKQQLLQDNPALKVELVPDSIDYFPSKPAHISLTNSTPLRVLWFGNISNIGLFEKYSDRLSSMTDVKVVVVTGSYGNNGSVMNPYPKKYPKVEFLPWSRDTFIKHLQSCQLSCLMHDGSVLDLAKSNNKMITSIAWGVPAVVSLTPEYERTAQEAGIEKAVFSNETELCEAIDGLRSAQARAIYQATAQPEIWKRYSPEAVAKTFLNIVGSIPSSRINPADIQTALAATVESLPVPATSLARQTRQMVRNFMPHRLKTALAPYVPSIRTSLILDPARPSTASAQKIWEKASEGAIRMQQTEQQRSELKPLALNPSVEDVKTVLRTHKPESRLEVGCGSGKLLSGLATEFNIEGCDKSADMLRQCELGLKVFQYDIAVAAGDFEFQHVYHWDVLLTRGTMAGLVETPLQTAFAMNNMLLLARTKILVWERPEVCWWMQQFSDSPKFEYHPVSD